MKTRMIQAILLGSILAMILSSGVWARERSQERPRQRMDKQTQRMDRQAQRIDRGFRNGEITRKENRHLNREQRRIGRAYDRSRSDGHLNRQERHRLNRMQDRASRHIYRDRHNKATRYRHHPPYKGGHKYGRYDQRPFRRHYWHKPRRYYHRPFRPHYGHKPKWYYHRRPIVHHYYEPYPAETYSADSYQFSASVSEPGWSLALSTEGSW
jgi:hypothetical protein